MRKCHDHIDITYQREFYKSFCPQWNERHCATFVLGSNRETEASLAILTPNGHVWIYFVILYYILSYLLSKMATSYITVMYECSLKQINLITYLIVFYYIRG